MNSPAPSYHGYRFPADIIAQAVWLYVRFSLSFRDVEDLLAQRGVTVTYETIRQWCLTFGRAYARRLRHRRGRMGDTWYLDEVFVAINGRQQYLWRAGDEDGDVLDILVQSRRNRRAAVRFFRKLLTRQGCVPRRLITDKLRSYPAARCLTPPPGRGFSTKPCESGSFPTPKHALPASSTDQVLTGRWPVNSRRGLTATTGEPDEKCRWDDRC